MPATPEKLRAMFKRQRSAQKEVPPPHLGKLDILFTIAMANRKMPWEVGTAPGQVSANSPKGCPGEKWRTATKDLKTSNISRAMSWNKDDHTWVSFSKDGVANDLTLREAFESTWSTYNTDWQQLMRDRSIINSIAFQLTDGTRIERAEAFRLNDLVNEMPTDDEGADSEENDTTLDAPIPPVS